MQRLAGNRAVAAVVSPRPVVQRHFVGALAGKTFGQVRDDMAALYEKVPPAWKFEPFMRDAETFDSYEKIAEKLRLTLKPGATLPAMTPPSTDSGPTTKPVPTPTPTRTPTKVVPTGTGTTAPSPTRLVPLRPTGSTNTAPSGVAGKSSAGTTWPPPFAGILRPRSTPGPTPTSEDAGTAPTGPKPKVDPPPGATVEAAVTPPAEGTLIVDTPIVVNEPRDNVPVFKAPPEYIQARMGNATFRIKAGQNYLNTALSAAYKADKGQIKGSKAKLNLPMLSGGSREPDVRVIGDGHHRFVWGAYHGEPVAADADKKPVIHKNWNELNYKQPPESMRLNPIGDPTEIQEELYRAWVSNEPIFKSYRAKGKDEFVKKMCAHKKLQWTAEAGRVILGHITTRESENVITGFDEFVTALVGQANNDRARRYGDYLKRVSFKTKPPVIKGPTVTTGFVDTVRNVITLDPAKNTTAEAMLDTLAFETQNARQREKLTAAKQKGGGEFTADVEYDSDKMYVYEALFAANNVTSLNDLVRALNIPTSMLTPATFEASFTAGRVDLPPRTELPTQAERQALWWWKTQTWGDANRKKMWIKENHGEGLGSSAAIYAK